MAEDFLTTNRSAYDQVAAQYAAKNAQIFPEMLSAADWLLAQVPDGARLLDLGCGPGRDLAWFAQQRPSIRRFGADLSTGMLAEARQRSHAALCQADMRRLGFASASFAGLWCVAAMLHLPRAEAPRAVAEMARVLVPGGVLHLCVQKGSGEGLEKSLYDPPVERFFASHQPEELSEMLVTAGFTILNTGDYTVVRHWLWFQARKPL